ncbi:MAG: SPFH domain-containing protein [Desulfotalea sp.]
MSFINNLKQQLRSVIEWNDNNENLFHEWSGNGDEIKNASKLIVGPGQGCIFVYEGKVISILDKEGLYDLKTDNVPFWTSIKKILQSFESEHKTNFYFYKVTRILDQKWGTTSSIKYIDPTYQFPIGLKSYGNFSFLIQEPKLFFTTVVGHKNNFSISDFRSIMVSRLTMRFSDYVAESAISYIDIDAHREEIAAAMMSKLGKDFKKFGFSITDFRIEGLDYDQETQTRIDRIGDVAADVFAAKAAGIDYVQLQKLEALKDSAKNEGGAAGIGVGMGAGIGMGQMMSNNFTEPNPPKTTGDIETKLISLKHLYVEELISEKEYKTKKQELLASL